MVLNWVFHTFFFDRWPLFGDHGNKNQKSGYHPASYMETKSKKKLENFFRCVTERHLQKQNTDKNPEYLFIICLAAVSRNHLIKFVTICKVLVRNFCIFIKKHRPPCVRKFETGIRFGFCFRKWRLVTPPDFCLCWTLTLYIFFGWRHIMHVHSN